MGTGEPFGEPGNPRSPPRWRPGASGVLVPLSSRSSACTASSFCVCLGFKNQCTPRRGVFLEGSYDEWAPEMGDGEVKCTLAAPQ
ncbi:hypothetical protein U0070_015108 [Myodes glareolus]|uniref:Uncharacterized protein n=1 Tax=Myodes glareolus TaxID=447135 RepID=A0AAW0JZD5_MYOGA